MLDLSIAILVYQRLNSTEASHQAPASGAEPAGSWELGLGFNILQDLKIYQIGQQIERKNGRKDLKDLSR